MNKEERTITIRRMTIADVPGVYHIEKDCFSTPWSKQSFVDEMERNPVARYLVAIAGEEIVGYAGAWLILEEGHITNIGVLREYRGQGIGEKLAKGLLTYSANLGVQYMTLEVRKSNIIAQKLYEKMGFQKVGTRKKYYEDNGEDALLMVCDKMPAGDPNFTETETLHTE